MKDKIWDSFGLFIVVLFAVVLILTALRVWF